MPIKKYIVLLLFIPYLVKGQDVHFSQIFAQPLLTNPANTGNFSGLCRVGLNYRDQWGSVTVPYKTYDVYTDFAIQRKRDYNRFGIGLMAIADKAGDGILATQKAYISTAYHIGYDKTATYRISFGMYGGIVQKSVDYAKLTFDSQWDDHQFNASFSNNEANTKSTLSYLDVGAGALFTLLPYENERIFFGISASHVNQPEESFYGQSNKVGIRTSAVGGAFLPIGSKASFQPQVYIQSQKSAMEIIGGANFILPLTTYNDSYKSVFGGLWYRYKDAAWLAAGMSLGNLTFSFSYDLNVSKLTPASNSLGGFEMAIVYTFNKFEKKDPMKCPGFE
jgi:type IX secretion system PorP/SprF family membrane protein